MTYGGFGDHMYAFRGSSTGTFGIYKVFNGYKPSGIFESSTTDWGEAVNLAQISWNPTSQPAQCGADPVKFQIATNNSDAAPWVYFGPDGTPDTYYTVAAGEDINLIHNNYRYARYKVYFSTADVDYTPTVGNIVISYTTIPGAPPRGAGFQSVKSGDWYDPTTWTPGAVPGPGASVRILSTHTVRVTGQQYCRDLVIAAGAILELDAASGDCSLTLDDNTYIQNNGTMRYANATTNSASFYSQDTLYLGPNEIDWNSQTNCHIGGFTYKVLFSVASGESVTLSGEPLKVANTVGVDGTLNVFSSELYITMGDLIVTGTLTGGA
ncbi:MAG: hypothetical protein KAI63_01110, partial [Planctomycetes bacterium]|nr:hypothetical protein [Planctomycetota bacterium]